MAETVGLRRPEPPAESGPAATAPAAASVGDRVRALRAAAQLTQSELAGGQFSKEYISQVERGKTRPSPKALAWLAAQLGTDRAFLQHGISTVDSVRAESLLERAEGLSEQHHYGEAVEAFRSAAAVAGLTAVPSLALRSLVGEAWAHSQQGEIDEALGLLEQARTLADQETFGDVERADVLFRIGVCRYKLSKITEALALFRRALQLVARSGEGREELRSDIHHWRSRCFRRQREWDAAREDIALALELAESIGDRHRTAAAYFQASLVAEREGNWLLARQHGERAKALFEELGDEANVGRMLNNLGGINHLLGNNERAVELLGEAFERAVETGLTPDAGHVLCSLAEVHLAAGNLDQAEVEARKALDLLDGRDDYLHEIGIAQLALGRAQLEQGRLDEAEQTIFAADRSFEQIASVSHRANAWVAKGDIAKRRGDTREAARHYRRAAEALQDARF